MKPTLLLFLLSVFGCAWALPVKTFNNCVIAARASDPNGTIVKFYRCNEGLVSISGNWSQKGDRREEFGRMWLGEILDFGWPVDVSDPAIAVHKFKGCSQSFSGERANYSGYMSIEVPFTCAGAQVLLEGLWEDEFQGNWNYRLQFGEVNSTPQWVDDPKKIIDFCTFQKYCKTKFGWRLCGWVEEPKVDHGKPAPFKRDAP